VPPLLRLAPLHARLATLRAHPDLRAVVRLALPAIANSLLQTLVFLVDRLMLGHHSEQALAAMQTAGPLVWTVFSVFGAFAVGTVAVVGRAVGAREPHEATSAARGSIALALALGTVLALVGSVTVGPMVDAFGSGGGPEVRAVAVEYLRVALPGMPAFLLGLTFISILQAAGDTRTPLLIGLATNALNIVGNWFLVFGHGGAPRLGATGSAASTVAAATLECVLGLWALRRATSPVSLRHVPGVDSWQGVRRVVRIAWSSWGERVIYHAGYLAFVGFVIRLGATAMAANQALISIESISFLTADGCAVAAGALVAQRLGAREPVRAQAVGWIAAGLCAAILGTCGLVFLAIPEPLVRAFRDDPTTVHMGSQALRVAAFAQVPMAVGVVLAQAMRGAGATREALAVSFLGVLLVRIAATYVFVGVLRLGLTGVWLGSTADWYVRAAVYGWRWARGAWKTAR
jgi:putative MATE family efflux protein